MRSIVNMLVHSVAPNLPCGICSYIYKKAGLKNCENVRNKTFIQNIQALKLGKNCFVNKFCKFYNGIDYTDYNSHITIGNNVTIGYGTTIITSTHIIGEENHRADFRKIAYKPVKIGDGTWICADCTINPGVTIGKGCVIASGSVVIKDCEDNCLYGGNPAKLIKRL